jgi:hypothetical protein
MIQGSTLAPTLLIENEKKKHFFRFSEEIKKMPQKLLFCISQKLSFDVFIHFPLSYPLTNYQPYFSLVIQYFV